MKTQNVTNLKNLKGDKTQQLKYNKNKNKNTKNVTKLQNKRSNCD